VTKGNSKTERQAKRQPRGEATAAPVGKRTGGAKAPQSALAATMDSARAFYGKGGPGEHVVQAKTLPEARTTRARLMVEVQAMADYAIDGQGPRTAMLLGFVVDMLAEGIAAMQAAPGSPGYPAALAGVWSRVKGKAAFVAKWDPLVRGEHGAVAVLGPPLPAERAKFLHGLLADALDVVGVHRPESFEWIRGLPGGHGAAVSVLGDFVVERTRWDADAETPKADLHSAYVQWLEAAKVAHPERYGDAEELTFKAFCCELNLSLVVQDARPERKGEARPRTWKGIRLLPPTKEPAGTVAIRWEAGFVEALRQSLVVSAK